MIIQGQVGPNPKLADGSNPMLRQGQQGDLITSNLHGFYYEQVVRGRVFTSATGAVSLPTSLNTTYTGLVVANPIGSGVNLVMLGASFAFSAVPTAAAVISLATGFNLASNLSGTTVADITKCCLVGQPAGLGVGYKAATLPTAATQWRMIGSVGTVATTSWALLPGTTYDIAGQIVLPPGGYILFNATAAQTATQVYLEFTWEEVPQI